MVCSPLPFVPCGWRFVVVVVESVGRPAGVAPLFFGLACSWHYVYDVVGSRRWCFSLSLPCGAGSVPCTTVVNLLYLRHPGCTKGMEGPQRPTNIAGRTATRMCENLEDPPTGPLLRPRFFFLPTPHCLPGVDGRRGTGVFDHRCV